MGKVIQIKQAIYGNHGKKDYDITDFLLQNRYRICKTTDLLSQFGDPYPNNQKFVDVQYSVSEERTELFEEEEFRIKNGGGRIGFENGIPFEIDIQYMYRYQVVDAEFEITNMVVRPAHYANREEYIVVEPSNWDAVVKKTNDGYYVVSDTINIVEWMGSDPFPYRPKIIELSYKREATYRIRVYEHGGYLLKDLVMLVELPLHRLNMIYHMYPKFTHHLASVHTLYLQKCASIFQKIIVCIADMNEEDEESNENSTNHMFAYPNMMEILHTTNDVSRKDNASFYRLLESSCQTKSDYTFYAHAKGFTEYQMTILPNVACWIELSYIETLSNIDVMIEQNGNFGGCFMETITDEGKLVYWRYPGNFYWIKSSITQAFVQKQLSEKTKMQEEDIARNFPKKMCGDGVGCLNLLPCKEGMHDLYNRVHILQFKTLIEVCARDTMSRRAVGLL
jgi:hypothetical protein